MSTVFRQYNKAEQLKLKHTVSHLLYIVMPLLPVTIAFILQGSYVSINSYNWWYLTLQPATLTLLCCFCGEKDRKLKSRAVLSIPVELKRVWDAKIFICLKMFVYAQIIFFLTVTATTVFCRHILKLTMVEAVGVEAGAKAVIVLTLTSIWQIPVVLTITQRAGFFPAFFMNMVMSLIGTIAMSIGSLWLLNPYAISARLMCPIVKILPNGLLAKPGNMTFSSELMERGQLLPGIAVALFWLVLLWALSRKWYEKKGAKTV